MKTNFFNDQDEFLSHIDDIDKKTRPWEELPVGDLKIEGSTGGMLWHAKDGSVFYLRDVSLRSLRQRLHSETELITLVSAMSLHGQASAAEFSKKFEDYYNWLVDKVLSTAGYDKEKVKISVVDGEVNAFLSSEYCEFLNSKYIYEKSFEKLIEITDTTEFDFKGWWDYSASCAEYTTPEIFKIKGKEYHKVIRIRTSDAGYSSIGVGCLLTDGTNVIPMMNDINIPHRASKKKSSSEIRKEFQESFNEALEQMDKVFNESFAKASDLAKIKLTHPKDCATKLAKTFGLPKKESLDAIALMKGDSAWNVYCTLASTIKDEFDIAKRIKQCGNVTKILGISRWDKYDAPFVWK